MSNHNEKYEKLAEVIREHREQKGALMPCCRRRRTSLAAFR